MFLLLIVLGAVGIVISAFPVSSGTSFDGSLEPHCVRSKIYGFGGHIHYTLEVDDDYFISIYVLNLEDTFEFIRTHEIGNLTPIISLEDVNSKEGIVPIIVPGLYSIIVINPSNMTITFEMFLNRIYPQVGILIPGGILVSLGIVGLASQKVIK